MEIPVNISEKDYYVYYRYRKVTKMQENFVNDLIRYLLSFFNSVSLKESDENDLISRQLFEFPPTLDKNFLYISCLYTLLKEYKKNNNNKKIIILANGIDKIYALVKICSKINQYYYKKYTKEKNKYNPMRIIPFYSRKQLCYNYVTLKNSNSFDMDTFCINLNKSTSDNKCGYYKNVIENKPLISSDNINNNNNNINNEEKNIPFECKDIDEQMNILYYSNLCPFYFYMNKIIKNDYDIIICERDYFFDNKKNISIRKMIDFDNVEYTNKYLLVFDEYNDIDDYLVKTYSCIIDEKLLHFSEYQLFKITKDINLNYNTKNDIINEKVIKISPETEIIRYNLFYDMKNYEFNGALKSKDSILSWLQKLLVIFFDFLKDKKKVMSPFSPYKFKFEFYENYFLEIEILEQIYKRFIILLNNIDYFQYDKIYHLLHFIFFACSLAKNNENYFVVNWFNINEPGEKTKSAAEFLLLKPNQILEILRQNHYVLNLTGGIGEESIVKSYYNFERMYQYEDDNHLDMYYKTNLYFANNINTTATETNFYGEILKMLAMNVPDGIICYFGNNKILNEYIGKWTLGREQVFTHVLNNKLIFIEENDSERLSNIIVNYKKAINNGRGAILFLTLNSNKGKYLDSLTGKYSRCIIFIGFPKMDILSNQTVYNLKRNYNKISGYGNDHIDNFESFKLFSAKITNKIEDRNDKTIILILENKISFLFDRRNIECYPKWLKKMISPEDDDERNNINEKIKSIPEFLSLDFDN